MFVKIKNHPAITHAKDIADICNPLKNLNITYFGHVHIDKSGQFSAINNNPKFHEHYLKKGYFNNDIHLAKSDQLKNYFVWDSIECVGASAQLYQESCDHGVKHTFTIVEKTLEGRNYYHFANDQADKTINQVYLSNIDLLHLFILHFKDKMNQSRVLSRAYDLKFSIAQDAEYTLNNGSDLNQKSIRQSFLTEIRLNKLIDTGRGKPLSIREVEILMWLHYGKSSSEIALILGIADITVHKHIAKIKEKTQCYTQFQLGELFSRLFGSSKEVLNKICKTV